MIERLDEYQDQCLRTMANDLDDATANMVLALGLAGESGEVADIVKKQYGHGHPADNSKIALELGDVLFYVAVLAHKRGFTLGDIARANVAKLQARYPEGFSSLRSLDR